MRREVILVCLLPSRHSFTSPRPSRFCHNLIVSRIVRTTWICSLLALVTFAVYWQVASFQFTNFDDPDMVSQNPIVRAGLTTPGLWWGLTTSWYDFWHPMVWWSFMLDCQLFGLNAGWHHLMNLAFHVANTLLLFIVLQRMTAATWRSAMVAALFALHPMHVESVAWIAERKDTLSAFFFLLTLLAYVGYVQSKSGPHSADAVPNSKSTQGSHAPTLPRSSLLYYSLSLLFFTLGLMSKSMLVTTPFVLLLLDYWPLQRFQPFEIENRKSKIKNLLVEKLPFLALSLASCIITMVGMGRGHNLVSTPWSFRVENALVSYARYLGKLFLPIHLMPLYPTPPHWAFWQVAGSALLIAIISLAVLLRARSAGYLLFGWFMFLGTLVPVIGLVSMSRESMADRYTYIPSIGLFVAVVWGISDVVNLTGETRISRISTNKEAKSSLLSPLPPVRSLPLRALPFSLQPLAFLLLAACAWLSYVQIGYWRDNLTLWNYCLKIDPNNAAAHFSLGRTFQDMGRIEDAATQYRASLETAPDDPRANLNYGAMLAMQGKLRDATNYFSRALKVGPGSSPTHETRAHENLGIACLELGNYQGGLEHCREAVRLDPRDVRAMTGLARALGGLGRSDEAMKCYADALTLNPSDPRTYYYQGLEYEKHRKFDDAGSSLAEAVRLAPNWTQARQALDRVRQGGQR
jgi:Flp pilus assembly protein TadD